MLPLSLLVRALVFYSVYCISDPTNWLFFITVPLTHVCYYIVVIVQTSYMQKMYPKEIRGMCMSVQGIFSTLGSFLYLAYG